MGLPSFPRGELLSNPPRHAHPWSVRMQDVDAAGVVFFATAFEMFNDAFASWCGACGWPIARMLGPAGVALPIRHAEADFFAPLRLGYALSLQVVACRVAEDELVAGYRIDVVEARASRPAIVGQTRHVCVSTPAFTRTKIPEELAAGLAGSPPPA